jgi:hypothetical protein
LRGDIRRNKWGDYLFKNLFALWYSFLEDQLVMGFLCEEILGFSGIEESENNLCD